MSCNSIVKASLSEDAKGGGEVLLAVQTLFFQSFKPRVATNLECFAGCSASFRTGRNVASRLCC